MGWVGGWVGGGGDGVVVVGVGWWLGGWVGGLGGVVGQMGWGREVGGVGGWVGGGGRRGGVGSTRYCGLLQSTAPATVGYCKTLHPLLSAIAKHRTRYCRLLRKPALVE